MKKSLIILGLLVCSTGYVFADEVASTDVSTSAAQQIEIQNTLDRNNFENAQKMEHFNRSLERNDADKIKYDNSVSKNKYKNFDKKNDFSKLNNKKQDKKIVKKSPSINDRKYNRDYREHKPLPKERIGNPQRGYHAYGRPHHPRYMSKYNKPSIHGYNSRPKLNKVHSRRAYNKNVKRK